MPLPMFPYYDEQYNKRKANKPAATITTAGEAARILRNNEIRDNLFLSASPDTVARVNRIARETGELPLLVEDRINDYEKSLVNSKFVQVAGDNPGIAKWAVNNPRAAAAAADDWESLSMVGKAWRAVENIGSSLKVGLYRAGAMAQDTLDAVQEVTDTVLYPLDAAIATIGNNYGLNLNPDRDMRNRRQAVQERRAGNEAYVEANRPQVEGWFSRNLLAGVESVPLTAAAVLTRNASAGSTLLGGVVGGSEYQAGREKGLNPFRASVFGATQGAIETLTERIPVSRLMGDIAAKSPVGKTLINQLVAEIPGEQAATFLQDLNEWATLNPEKTLAEFVAERPSAAAETLVQTIGGVGTTVALTKAAERTVDATVKVGERVAESRRAKKEGAFLDDLAKASEGSKLRERDTEAFREMIRSLADENDIKTVYISGEALQEYMQSESFDAEGPLSRWTAEVEEAAALGGDVVMPIEEAMAVLPGTPAWQALRDDMRLSPGGISRKEAQTFDEAMADVMDELARTMAEQEKTTAKKLEPIEKLSQSIAQKLQNVGFTPSAADTQARLLVQRYATRAERLGRELTGNEFDVTINQVLPEGIAQARAADNLDLVINSYFTMKKPKEQTGKSLVEWIASRGGITDEGGDLAAMGLGDWHKQKAFRKKVIRQSDKNQGDMLGAVSNDYSPNRILEAAIDEGYFPELQGTEEALDLNALLTAIEEELQGKPRYAQERIVDDVQQLAVQLDEFLSQSGFDPANMTREEMRAAIMQAQDAQEGGYEQLPDTIEIDGVERPTRNSNGQPLAQTEEGVRNFWNWFGDSKVVDAQGRPLVVYHGTPDASFEAFNPDSFFTEKPEIASIYTSASASSIASKRKSADAQAVIPAYLAISEPFDTRLPEVRTDFEQNYFNKWGTGTPLSERGLPDWNDARDISEWIDEEGKPYDGIVLDEGGLPQQDGTVLSRGVSYVALKPEQIKSVNNRGTFDPADARILFQQDEQGNPLVVVHNLSADKFRNADELGGLAAPSIAVIRADIEWNNFGDITLIGSPDLVDPKDKSAKGFNADVYSPRQPRAQFDLHGPTFKKLQADMQDAARDLGESLDTEFEPSKLSREGLAAIEGSAVAKLAYLRSIGESVRLVYSEKPNVDKRLVKAAKGARNAWDLRNDPKFVDALRKVVEEEIAETEKRDADVAERLRLRWFEGDGELNYRLVEDRARQAILVNGPPSVDRWETRKAIDKKIEASAKKAATYRLWVQENYAGLIAGRFFEARDSGRRKDYTMENLVREMTRTIRDGEGYNYGVGSLRSNVAKQFRSIKEMQSARDSIISEKEMDAIKTEVSDEMMALGEKFAPYHGSGKDFGWMDIFTMFLKDLSYGRTREWQQEIFNEPVPDSLIAEAREFLGKLRDLPTEYFEVKMQRAVDFSEFAAAVVPDDTSKDVIDRLKEYGLKVEKYPKSGSRVEAIQRVAGGDRVLFQSYGEGPRGRITFNSGQATIDLFQNRNLSTFLHEVFHLWLEELRFDAEMPDAPEQLKADWQKVQDWFASQGHKVENGFIPVEAHEMWARGGERYLMEGKAPNRELKGIFETFRAWLTAIYKVVDALKSPITPEIRGVMDRLIATDEQLQDYAEQQRIAALFKTAADAGMTGAEFAEYQRQTEEARTEANSKLIEKTMRVIRARETKRYKEAEATVREEITADVDARPLFKVLRLLKTSPMDEKWIRSEMGEDSLSLLPRRVPPTYKSGGVHPDVIAEQSGFASGKAMVEALMGAEIAHRQAVEGGDQRSMRERTIAGEVDAIMQARYGDPLNDGTIEREALEAVHNEMQGEVIAAEIRVLARRTGRRPTPYAIARDWARNKIRQGVVSVEASPSAIQRYARAAAKAATKAQEAMLAQDVEEAFRQKQAQMVNNALVAEAKAAADEVEKAVKRMEKIAKRKTIKSVDQEYLEQAQALLENVDLRRRSQVGINRQNQFEAWAQEQQAAGHDVPVPPSFEQTLGKTNWTRLSVENLLSLDETIKHIMHLGRLKKTLLDNKERRDFDELVKEATDSAGNLRQRPPSDLMAPSYWDGIKSKILAADAALLKMETVFDWLDGNNPNGVFNRIVFRPIADAQEAERLKLQEYIEKLTDALKAVPKEVLSRWGDKVTTGLLNRETGRPFIFTRDMLVSMALNVGNQSNLDKLAGGYGWNESEILATLASNLTEAEWQYVQSVWDTIDGLWPEIEAMEKRINGVAPEKIEARPVETPFGTLRGGYFPVVYDPARNYDAEANAAKGRDLFETIYTRATTPKGFTKERTNVERPIHLSLGIINRHVAEVIHDLTHREAIMQADKFLSDKRVMKAVDDTLGPEVRRQFRPWLQRIANEWAYDRAGNAGAEKFLRTLRANATIVGMGFRLSTILMQAAGYSNSFERVGFKWVARRIKDVANPAAYEFVLSKSAEVAGRMDNLDRDIRDNVKSAMGKTDWLTAPKRFAFHGIAYMDRMVVIPTWLGAYDKAVAEGMADEDAVYAADKAVRQSQGSGAAKDLAAIQSGRGPAGEALKLMTMFYSYMSAFYQRQRSLGRDTRNGSLKDMPALLARAWWLIVVPPVLAELLAGRGPDEDEDEALWAFEKMMLALVGPIPLARDIAPIALARAKDDPTFGYKFTPVSGAGQSLINVVSDVSNVIEGEETKRATRNMIEAVGYFTGLTTGQMAAAAQFLVDVGYGEQDPQDFSDWWEGLNTGKIKEE